MLANSAIFDEFIERVRNHVCGSFGAETCGDEFRTFQTTDDVFGTQ